MDNKQVVGLTKDVDDQEVTWELLLDQVEEEPNETAEFLDRCHVLELIGEEEPQMGRIIDRKENLIIGVDGAKQGDSIQIFTEISTWMSQPSKVLKNVMNIIAIGEWNEIKSAENGQPVSEFYSGQCTPSRDNALSGFGDTRSRNRG